MQPRWQFRADKHQWFLVFVAKKKFRIHYQKRILKLFMNISSWRLSALLLLTVVVLNSCIGCGDADESSADSTAPPVLLEPDEALPPLPLTVAELRSKLKANENARFQKVGGEIVEAHLIHSGVSDISALQGLPLRVLDLGMLPLEDISVLKGMPLRQLWLEGTQVSDIQPLAGMSLTELYLQSTKVTDLSVLADMPIKKLNLMSTPVTDLSPLKNMPLNTLWMPETAVSDLSVLQGKKLESLDIRGSKVTDLSQISGLTTLKRLNIVDCEISDLTPLKGLSLDRMLLTPANIQSGMDVLRNMSSLHSIGTDGVNVSNVMEPVRFWVRYDDGDFAAEVPETPESSKSPDKAKPGEQKESGEQTESSEKPAPAELKKPAEKTTAGETSKPADQPKTSEQPKSDAVSTKLTEGEEKTSASPAKKTEEKPAQKKDATDEKKTAQEPKPPATENNGQTSDSTEASDASDEPKTDQPSGNKTGPAKQDPAPENGSGKTADSADETPKNPR